MNCRPGDLAVIRGLHPSLSEANGRFVELANEPPIMYEGEPSWRLTKRVDLVMLGNGQRAGKNFYIGESVWFEQLQDKYLFPIRDPGDEAQDLLLSPISVKEIA